MNDLGRRVVSDYYLLQRRTLLPQSLAQKRGQRRRGMTKNRLIPKAFIRQCTWLIKFFFSTALPFLRKKNLGKRNKRVIMKTGQCTVQCVLSCCERLRELLTVQAPADGRPAPHPSIFTQPAVSLATNWILSAEARAESGLSRASTVLCFESHNSDIH